MTVADDGIGAEGLFDVEGEDKLGAGSRIVKGLVRQLGATMAVGSQNGTTVVINIPEKSVLGLGYE